MVSIIGTKNRKTFEISSMSHEIEPHLQAIQVRVLLYLAMDLDAGAHWPAEFAVLSGTCIDVLFCDSSDGQEGGFVFLVVYLHMRSWRHLQYSFKARESSILNH